MKLRPTQLLSSAVVGAVTIAFAAQVALPIGAVPITLQTLALFVVAMLGGARIGLLAALLYLLAAWLGVPVLSGWRSLQPDGILGAKTAGFVVGFVPAAWWLARVAGPALRRPTLLHTLLHRTLMALAAHAVVLAVGGAWLAFYIGVGAAWQHGVQPFLLPAVAKSALAALFVSLARGAKRVG
ncbi:MAG: biotin transporter BioY [Planctomycetota bacterium]